MKAYKNRNYEIQIVKPQPQTQKINVGMWIRRTIGKGLLNTGTPVLPVRTFRVRRGNGYYGTTEGELIQDQYNYNVSDPNADNCPDIDKLDFAAAVLSWQGLDPSEKKLWNTAAQAKELHMSGYNLYIREYRLGLL